MNSRDSSDGTESEVGPKTPSGWPSWAIGLALLVLVLVIIGGAFVLNDRLRPKVGLEMVTGMATATLPDPRSSTPSQAVSRAVATGSPVALATVASTVDTSSARQAVLQAYLHYWDVYSEALLSLDPSHLPDVMAGDELTRAQQLIEQLHSQQHALKTQVVHHFEITSIERDAATLTDDFVNQSYEIDAVTKQPVGTPSPATAEPLSYRMQLVGGVWKVVRAIKVTTTVVQQ